MASSCLHTVGFQMPRVIDVVPLSDVDGVMDALTERLTCVGPGRMYCLRVAPSQGVVSCTYEQWFRPVSPRRRYCQLPVSGRRMQRFLQFRLGCHALPIAIRRLAGSGRDVGFRVLAKSTLHSRKGMWTGPTAFVWLATVGLLVVKSTWFLGDTVQP